MSANLSKNDNLSEDLDLNSDAVSLGDQNEISGVGVTESLAATNASADEIVTEGGTDEVRVSGGGENPVESLSQRFDVQGEAESVSDLKYEDQRSDTEVVKAECSTAVTTSLVAEIQVDEGETAVMDNKVAELKDEFSGVDALDRNPSCSEKNQTLEAEEEDGSTGSLTNGCLSCKDNTSSQDGKHEAVSQVAHTDSNPNTVDGDEGRYSNHSEENPNEGACAADSNSVSEVIDGTPATGLRASLHSEAEPNYAQATESEPLAVGNLVTEVEVTECHASEEEQKAGMEVVKGGTLQACSTLDTSSDVEITGGSQPTGVSVSHHNEAEFDSAQVTESVEPSTTGNIDSEVQAIECHASEDEDRKDGMEVVNMESSEVCGTVDSISVAEVTDGSQATEYEERKAGLEDVKVGSSRVCVTVDSNSVADASQVTGGCVALHSEAEPNLAQVTEEPLGVGNPNSEVQVVECNASEDERKSEMEVVKVGSSGVCGTVDSISFAEVTDGSQATVGNSNLVVEVTEFHVSEYEERKAGLEDVKVGSSRVCATVDSNSVADASQVTGGCVALHSEAEPNLAQVTEEPLGVGNPNSEVQVVECNASEDERKSEMEVVKVGSSGVCGTVDSISFAEVTDEFQATGMFSSRHGEAEPNFAQVTECVESLAVGNSNLAFEVTEFHVSEYEAQKAGLEDVKVGSSRVCLTADSSSVADASQVTGGCVALHSEAEPNLAQVTEEEPLGVGNPNSEVQVVECNASEDEQKYEMEVVKVGSSQTSVIVDSNSVSEVTDGSQAMGVCDSSEFTESIEPLMVEKLDPEVQFNACQVLEDEEQKIGIDVIKVESSQVSVTVDSGLVDEITNGSGATVLCASLHSIGEPDSAQAADPVVPLEIGNPDPEVHATDCHVLVDEDGIAGMEVVNMGRSQSFVTVDSNSVVEITIGSQATSTCAYQHSETEPDSAQFTESIESLPDGNLHLEVKGTELDALGDEEPKSEMEVLKAGSLLACATICSNSVGEVINGSHTTVVSASLCSEGEPDSAQLTEEPFLVGNLDSRIRVPECSASEVEGWKAGVEVVKVGSSQACATLGSNSVAQITTESQATGMCALYGEVKIDSAQVTESVEPLAVGNLDSEVQKPKYHALQVEEWKAGMEAVQMGSSQTFLTVDSNSVAEFNDGSQAINACASLRSKSEPDLAQDTEIVEPFVVGNLNSMVQASECHCLEDEELKKPFPQTNLSDTDNTKMQDVKKDAVSQVTETFSNQVDGGEIMNRHPDQENPHEGAFGAIDSNSLAGFTNGFQATGSCASLHNEVRSDSIVVTDALGGIPSCSDKNESLETEIMGGIIGPFPDADPSYKENTSIQGAVAQVAETTANQVDGDEIMDLQLVKENPKESACVIDGSQAQPTCSCASQHGEGVPGFSQHSESVGPLESVNPDSEIEVEGHASEDEMLKVGTKVAKLGCTAVITESLVEQIEVVGEEVVAVYQEEALEMKDDFSGIDTLEDNPLCMENNQNLETEVVGGITESPPDRDFSHSRQDEKQTTVVQVVETVSNQVENVERMYSHLIKDNLNEGAYVIINSNSVAEVTAGSQATSMQPVTDVNQDSEFKVSQGRTSPLHNDQIMVTHVSEIGNSPGSSKLDEKDIMGSHVSDIGESQISGNECIIGGPVEDLDSCPGKDGNLYTEDEVTKENISPPDACHGKEAKIRDMGGDVGFSLSGISDVDAAGDGVEAGHDGNQKLESAQRVAGLKQMENIEVQTVKCPEAASEREYAARYCLSPEKEGEYSISDLVWGKVRSHPWWPGQIFDSSDSSEQAMKYQKKDSFLVAYFGDRTFAWNEASSLKPFRTHFSQMEKQSSSETFRSAVNCALDEVSRRIELGMACSCTPKEAYAKVKYQIIENVGIREEARLRDGVDKSLSAASFEANELVQYIKALAQSPCGGGDRLELVIARAQLMAFYRLKGYFQLPEFHVYGGLLENDADCSLSGEIKHSQAKVEHATPVSKNEEQVPSGKVKQKNQHSSSRKRKHSSEDGVYPSRKERSLSELMAGEKAPSYVVNGVKTGADEGAAGNVGSSSGTKRKATDSFSDDSEVKIRKQILSTSKEVDTGTPAPRSFKVGECIRRIASQLTGSPPILKCSRERFQNSVVKVDRSSEKPDGVGGSPYASEERPRRRVVIPKEYSSTDEMLSQLCLAARDPMKGYSFLTIIVDFFTDFRNSINLDRSNYGRQKKSEKMGSGKTGTGNRKTSITQTSSTNTFDFEDMSDSYWTDRIIQSSPEEQPSHENMKTKGESQLDSLMEEDDPSFEHEDYLQLIPCRDQNLNGDHDLVMEKPSRKTRRRKRKSQLESPVEHQHFDGNHDMVVGKQLSNLNGKSYADDYPMVLILSFTEVNSVPSETNLNKIFSRFGPLKESETEVVGETSSARVVFKKRTDAEVAFSSARKFNIFGSVPVSYQLMHFSSTSSKASTGATTQAIDYTACAEDMTI